MGGNSPVRWVWFLAGIVLGGLTGAFGMIVAFPFLFPPEPVDESVGMFGICSKEPILTTAFREDAPGQDAAHWGRGSVTVYDAEQEMVCIEFARDFEVGPGPNFWIYLNAVPDVLDEEGFLADHGRMRIAKLKSFIGSQVYPIDRKLFEEAQSITVWCESFNQYITSASLANG